MIRIRTLLLLPASFLSVCPLIAQEQQLLRHSIVGSNSCAKKPCFDEAINSIPVQRILLELAAAPLPTQDVEAALKDGDVPITDLLQLRLIRRDGDRYFLNFALFTASDVKQIRESSEVYAGSLANAMLSRRDEIDAALRTYQVPGVDPKAVAYFVLGCASLDWDGLDLTAAKGYRKASEPRPDGDYVPDAEQITSASLEHIYWGSHNTTYDGAEFTSFGDHASSRYTLPDLLWRIPGRIADTGYPGELKPVLESLLDASLQQTAVHMTHMLLALHDEEKTLPQLAQAANLQEKDAKPLVQTLLALQFISADGDRYQATIPVFTKRDETMARRLVSIGHQVMEQWLVVNYPKMKGELNDLSFIRAGVPFEDGFTMIWHYVFGMANRKLIEAGLFADPYSPNRKYKGSISALSQIDLP
jgi:hypothetical protein